MPTEKPLKFWDYKPWWCQPWSIVLTGIVIVLGSWLLFHRWLITSLFVGMIGLWWAYFLIFVPWAVQQAQNSPPK